MLTFSSVKCFYLPHALTMLHQSNLLVLDMLTLPLSTFKPPICAIITKFITLCRILLTSLAAMTQFLHGDPIFHLIFQVLAYILLYPSCGWQRAFGEFEGCKMSSDNQDLNRKADSLRFHNQVMTNSPERLQRMTHKDMIFEMLMRWRLYRVEEQDRAQKTRDRDRGRDPFVSPGLFSRADIHGFPLNL